MKIFISWSGAESERIANTLANWLPLIFQNVQPWVSTQNVPAGSRWSLEIAGTLDDAHFGILCVTPDNLAAPWLLFEAGALAKSVEHGRVVPYLIGLLPSQLTLPLSQFHAVVADKQGTRRLVQAIEASQPGTRRPDQYLDKVFEAFWPELEANLGLADAASTPRSTVEKAPHTQAPSAAAPAKAGESPRSSAPRKTTEATFLQACPEWARGFFKTLLQEAVAKGLTVSWGTKGFSIRANRPSGEPVSVLYGYPSGLMDRTLPSLEIYLKYLTPADAPDSLRASLLSVGGFGEQGQYTIGLPLTPETLPQATAALPFLWAVYERIRKPTSGAAPG